MKISFAFALLTTTFSSIGVHGVSEEECKKDYLPSVLDCWNNSTINSANCPLLPIPDHSMPKSPSNDRGYYLEHIRDTPTTHVFALGDTMYNSMIVVDVASAADMAVGKAPGKDNRRNALRGRQLQEGPNGLGFPKEDSFEDKEAPEPRISAKAISFGLIDFPRTFYQRNEDGSIGGYHVYSAVIDILDMLNSTLDDVHSVELIYSHGHMDHIGAANYTYNAIKTQLGLEEVPVVASTGTLHFLEELIEMGVYSYRAPLPAVTFDEKVEYTIGYSSKISMEPVEGHQHGGKDVLVFMEPVEDQPAIMMMVDIVFPKWAPWVSFAVTTDLSKYVDLHDTLLNDYDLGEDGYFIGGHVNQIGDRHDIEVNKNLTMTILEGAQKGLDAVNTRAVGASTGAFTPGTPNFGNIWAANYAIQDARQDHCAIHALETYGCVVAGLDVVIKTHCRTAEAFWSIDS